MVDIAKLLKCYYIGLFLSEMADCLKQPKLSLQLALSSHKTTYFDLETGAIDQYNCQSKIDISLIDEFVSTKVPKSTLNKFKTVGNKH